MSRLSNSQFLYIIDFMESYPNLARGLMSKTIEGRVEAQKLWKRVTSVSNSMDGVHKTTQALMKYWADKKSNVRKVALLHGNTNLDHIKSFTESKIRILALVGMRDNTEKSSVKKPKLKTETVDDDVLAEEESMDYADRDSNQQEIEFDQPASQEREMAVMEKLVQVMSEQATALSQLAQASQIQTRAMAKLADASQLQANAVQQIALNFERIANAIGESNTAISNIDKSIQRYTYSSFVNTDT